MLNIFLVISKLR